MSILYFQRFLITHLVNYSNFCCNYSERVWQRLCGEPRLSATQAWLTTPFAMRGVMGCVVRVWSPRLAGVHPERDRELTFLAPSLQQAPDLDQGYDSCQLLPVERKDESTSPLCGVAHTAGLALYRHAPLPSLILS